MANCTPWNAIFPKAGCYPNKIKSGVSPQMSAPSVTDGSREVNRMILRNVWNTAPQGTLANRRGAGYRGRWANSSFRIVNNAGDVLSRQNYSCGGSNLVGSHPGMLNLTYGGGQSKANCDGSGIAPSTCNVKYVYDSSDFIRYRKLKALNASYVSPDYTDGGANGLGNKGVKKYSYDQVFGLAPLPMPAAMPLFLPDENGELDIRITIGTQERVFRIANWEPSGKTRDEILDEVRSADFDLIQDKQMIKDLYDKFIVRPLSAPGGTAVVDTDTFGNIRMDQFQERINSYVRDNVGYYLTFSAASNLINDNNSAVEIASTPAAGAEGRNNYLTIIGFTSNYLINDGLAEDKEPDLSFFAGGQMFFVVERKNPSELDIIAKFQNEDGKEFALWNHTEKTDIFQNEASQWTGLGYTGQLTSPALTPTNAYDGQPFIKVTFPLFELTTYRNLQNITRVDGIKITDMVEQIEEYYKKRINTIPNSPPQNGVSLENLGDYYLKYQIISKSFHLLIFYKKSNGKRVTLIRGVDYIDTMPDLAETNAWYDTEFFYLLEKNN